MSLRSSGLRLLRAARDGIAEIPDVPVTYGSLAVALGDCSP
jgi:hypothetical protein